MALYIHNREFAIDFGIEYPQGDVVQNMALFITMGDIAVENCAVYPYWVRCGRVRHCTFLLKTLH